MSSVPQQDFKHNAFFEAIKKHTPTRKDPSFYSWHERNPGTLYKIERRTSHVGSSPDTATKAAGFAEFCRFKYACKATTFTVQGFWLSDKVGEDRVIRLILSEDLPLVNLQYCRPEYYSLTIPDKQPNLLLDHTTVAEIMTCIKYDSYKHCIVYNKKLSPEEEAAIAIQSRFRGNLARMDVSTQQRNREVKINLNNTKKENWKKISVQGVKNQAATILEKSSGVIQNWQYKSKGVTETSAEELNFLKKKRMASEARRRWKHSGILAATSARMDRLQQLHLVEKDEKTDNVFYKSKFDKIPHISTTRALPSTQKWKWKQQVQADDQSISYFHFSDYNEKDYTVDGIQPVMPRKPTPVGKEPFKIPTTYNVPRGQFGEVSRLSPSKSRKLILHQRQNISVFKPV
eukprot:g15726.t1